jgi:hypothetical protein
MYLNFKRNKVWGPARGLNEIWRNCCPHLPNAVKFHYRAFREMGVGGLVGQEAKNCLTLARAFHAMHEAGAEYWTEHDSEALNDRDCREGIEIYVVHIGFRNPGHPADTPETKTLACLGHVDVFPGRAGDDYIKLVAAELATEIDWTSVENPYE